MLKQKADEIIIEYLQKIYGFAVKKSYSYDEAEELCSEIIQKVYSSLLKAEDVSNIEGYIWRISEHTYSKYVASKKKHQGISIDGLQIAYYEKYFFENNDSELRRLTREIAFLSQKRRKIVYGFYYENKSVTRISKELGMPEGTVKWHLNQARNELKEGFSMERKIGKLGLSPIKATDFGHSGDPGRNGGPEYYLGDKLNLNIVYSVYHYPKTKEKIAEELGLTPVYIEDKINLLEENGFLVKSQGERYTTFVKFDPEKFYLEMLEKETAIQFEIADILAKEYVPIVREAIVDVNNVYIPSGNRELLDAAAVFYGIAAKCGIPINNDLSKYVIKTTCGGNYIAFVHINSQRADPDYNPVYKDLPTYWACGHMTRWSRKYPSVYSWSIDTRLCSREGAWSNNHTSDYEYLYELIIGLICDNSANKEKFERLRKRNFITSDNKPNIMIVNGNQKDFFDKIPKLDKAITDRFADKALELAMMKAKNYPPQMQDLIINWEVSGFIGTKVALMVMDMLYANGIFNPLNEQEKVTSNLIMFCDKLPTA